MNIRFGMNNFYTRYLKRFLNSEYQQSSNILGSFDKNDLNALVNYLDLPNTETIFEVQKGIVLKFPELKTLFNMVLEEDKIVFKGKEISSRISEFLQDNLDDIKEYCASMGWKVISANSWYDENFDINSDGAINELDRRIIGDIANNGTVYDDDIMKKADLNMDGFINQEDITLLDNYLVEYRISLVIASEGRKNIFPNEDMKVFVNMFNGDFMYDYAIRDDEGERH